ncbi:hypothetical protein Tco_0028273 [Tanacetum coccineum]
MFLRRLSIFFTCGEIPKGCNSTFIALIPNNPDANMVKDFRPISLIGSTDKSKIARKQSKSEQTRTRDSEEYKAEAKNVKPQSKP